TGSAHRAIPDAAAGAFISGAAAMEIRFSESAGVLQPGDTATLQLRITNEDWSNYDQSNDASFRPDVSSWQPADELLFAP
ncbi:MAG: hypothetical protein K2N94_12840, partial [Lachnospiraceae bacterium]|nr:hypothetical protein [Lachnospiraceae bacterium]